jgi:hypothetical protein
MVVVRLVPTTRRRCRPESGVDHVARTSNELDVEKVQPADITCGRKIGSAESSLAGPSSPGHVPDLLSRRCNFCVLNWVSWVVRWVDGVELSRKKGRLLSILASGSSHRPGWARWTLGGLMSGEPLFALPPRVLVAGRLQCGAARAGVRRGRGECAELAHLAPRLHDWFYARHAEKCPFFSGVGRNTILAMCRQTPYITVHGCVLRRRNALLFEITCCCAAALHLQLAPTLIPRMCVLDRASPPHGAEGCHGRYGTVCDILM